MRSPLSLGLAAALILATPPVTYSSATASVTAPRAGLTISGTAICAPWSKSTNAGQPVSGVQVELRTFPANKPGTDYTVTSTATSTNGEFSFGNLLGTAYALTFSHPSYGYKIVDVITTTDTNLTIELVSRLAGRMATISGRITQSTPPCADYYSMAPGLPACTVTVTPTRFQSIIGRTGESAAPDTFAAITDEYGSFRITSISAELFNQIRTWTLCAVKNGYDPQCSQVYSTAGLSQSVFIALQPDAPLGYASVSGRIIQQFDPSGQAAPLEGCAVSVGYNNYLGPWFRRGDVGEFSTDTILWLGNDVYSNGSLVPAQTKYLLPSPRPYPIPCGNQYVATSGPDGRFRIDSIPIYANEVSWAVSVYKDGFSQGNNSFATRLQLVPGENPLGDFVMERNFENQASVKINNTTFTALTDKMSYSINDQMRLRYQISNSSGRDIVFDNLPAGAEDNLCAYDLTLSTTSGETIYDLSTTTTCTGENAILAVSNGQSISIDFPAFTLDQSLASRFPQLRNNPSIVVTVGVHGREHRETLVSLGATLDISIVGIEPGLSDGQLELSARWSSRRGAIELTIPQTQDIAVSVFGLDGRIDRELSFNRRMDAGTHTIELKRPAGSARATLVRIEGKSFSRTLTVTANLN